MPSIDDVFGGTTLKADDIKGKNPIVTIENIQVKEFKEMKDGREVLKKKLIVSFVGAKKTLVCNVTNARRIAHILQTPDYTEWPGAQIGLKVEMVDFGGKVVDGIRVYDPADKIETGPQKKKAPISEEMEDEIPF